MILLAADTSSKGTSLALFQDGVVYSFKTEGGEPSASRLYLLLDAVLKTAGIGVSALQGLAIGAGPGSFTGLRVSFTALRTLAWTLKIPLVPVNSLEALVWPQHFLAAPLAVVQPARRGHVYQMALQAGVPIQEVGFYSFEEARLRIRELGRDVFLAGNPADLELDLPLLVQKDGPDAADIARMALPRLERGDYPPLEDVLPLYLRPSDAEVQASQA